MRILFSFGLLVQYCTSTHVQQPTNRSCKIEAYSYRPYSPHRRLHVPFTDCCPSVASAIYPSDLSKDGTAGRNYTRNPSELRAITISHTSVTLSLTLYLMQKCQIAHSVLNTCILHMFSARTSRELINTSSRRFESLGWTPLSVISLCDIFWEAIERKDTANCPRTLFFAPKKS